MTSPHAATRRAAVYLRDLTERVVMTFLQAFGAALVAGGWFDIDQIRAGKAEDPVMKQKAAWAGIAAVIAVVKGLVAKAVSRSDSASLAPGV